MTDTQTFCESATAKPAETSPGSTKTAISSNSENTLVSENLASSLETLVTTPTPAPISSNEPAAVATSTSQIKPQKSCGPDRARLSSRRHMLTADKYGDEHLSNQKKQRYWNSWEELFIVELWRRFRDEVTVINVPLPVYRKMMVAMRSRNMIVTAQDCRRKINTLNVRYRQELKRIELTGCKSDWRLFPLIHCVLQPKIKEYDTWHEAKMIKKLLDKLPKSLVEEKPLQPTTIMNNTNSHNHHQFLHTQNIPHNAGFYQPQRSFSSVRHIQPTHTASQTAENLAANSHLPSLTANVGQFEKPSILPFRNITMEKIEQLRQDNNRLMVQRDCDLKRLHMEEQNFRCFETFIRIWTEQKELELSRVQLLMQPNVNGENHNVERELQETVVAK